ncbi:hypothetical protein AB4K20DRAFT_1890728 [Rhizopus microsporus]
MTKIIPFFLLTSIMLFFKKYHRDSIHEFKVSSLQISSTICSASRNDFLDSLTHDVNTEEHEEECQNR